jgi:hypothetical protein
LIESEAYQFLDLGLRRCFDTSIGVKDLDQSPPLAAGEWTGLLDTNQVTYTRELQFVVRVQFIVFRYDLFEARMAESSFDPNDNGLRHFVGDNLTDTFFAVATGLDMLSHVDQAVLGWDALRIWERRVSQWAISFRSWRMR